jgi:hypothetical protein
MTMTRRLTSTMGFVGLQATNTIGYYSPGPPKINVLDFQMHQLADAKPRLQKEHDDSKIPETPPRYLEQSFVLCLEENGRITLLSDRARDCVGWISVNNLVVLEKF